MVNKNGRVFIIQVEFAVDFSHEIKNTLVWYFFLTSPFFKAQYFKYKEQDFSWKCRISRRLKNPCSNLSIHVFVIKNSYIM